MRSPPGQRFTRKPFVPLTQRVSIPSGVPPRRLAPDVLGPGACSCAIVLPDDDGPGRGVEVTQETSAIVIPQMGHLLIDCGSQALLLHPGKIAGLLPGPCSWAAVGAPGEPALVTVAVLPDGAVGRLLDEGGLWQFFLNIAARSLPTDAADMVCPLPRNMDLAADTFVPGRLCEGLLKWLGGHPYDESLYRFLARDALRHRVGEPEGEVPPSFVLDNPRGFPGPENGPAPQGRSP